MRGLKLLGATLGAVVLFAGFFWAVVACQAPVYVP